MIQLRGYQVDDVVARNSGHLLLRAARESDGRRVILKLHEDGPVPERDLTLDREFGKLRRLSGPGVVQALALDVVDGRRVLVVEDFGGHSLAWHLANAAQGLPPLHMMTAFVQACDALARVHKLGYVHGDVTPANLIWNSESGILKLVDFELSAPAGGDVMRSRQGQMWGTAPYVSPEQTGRLDVEVDARSDLYSLGVTLFEALTGERPLVAETPLDWLHAHLAERPARLLDVDPDLPTALAGLINTLLQKDPADRYQSARGLVRDLKIVARHMVAPRPVTELRLAPHNRRAGNLPIRPERLLGHHAEMRLIEGAVDRLVNGDVPPPLAVLGGLGIGKSSFVRELLTSAANQGVTCALGRFQRDTSSIPYSGFNDLLADVVSQVLAAGDDELESLQRVLDELPPDVQTAARQAFPALAGVLPARNRPAALEPAELRLALRRALVFVLDALLNFLGPGLAVLEDVHHCGPDSMQLLRWILTRSEPLGFLLIITCSDRDEEIPGRRDAVVSALGAERVVQLNPLSAEAVAADVADLLDLSPERAAPLGAFLHERSGGNPLFVREQVTVLVEQGALVNGHDGWEWDLDELRASSLPNSIAELLAWRLDELPSSTLTLMRVAACLGLRFSTAHLALQQGLDQAEVSQILAAALGGGFLRTARDADEIEFPHQAIRQTLLDGMDDASLVQIHATIARKLSGARHSNAIEAARHLAAIPADLLDDRLRAQLPALFLQAGLEAHRRGAFATSHELLLQGLSFVGDDTPDNTALDLQLGAANAATLSGDYGLAETILEQAGQLQLSPEQRHRRSLVQLHLLVSQGAYANALDIGIAALSDLDEALDISPPSAEIDEGILALNACPDGPALRALELLRTLGAPAFLAAPFTFIQLGFTGARITLQHGVGPGSAYTLVLLGAALCILQMDSDRGYRIGRIGLKLARRLGDPLELGRARFIFELFIRHTREPWLACGEELESLATRCLQHGDGEYATYAATNANYAYWFGGMPLAELIPRGDRAVALSQDLHQGNQARTHRAAVLGWRAMASESHESPDEEFEELLREFQNAPTLSSEFLAHTTLAQGAWLHGDLAAARKSLERLREITAATAGLLGFDAFHILDAIVVAESLPSLDGPERDALRGRADELVDALERVRGRGGGAVEASLLALQAAIHSDSGDSARAMRYFERAADAAERAQNRWVQGAVWRVTGQFHAAHGLRRWAPVCARTARHELIVWQKGEPLDPGVSDLDLDRDDSSLVRVVSGRSNQPVDLEAILLASQALAGQLDLHDLQRKLMHVLQQDLGADRVVLASRRGASWQVDAHVSGDEVPLAAAPTLDIREVCSLALLHYAEHTGETLALHDACRDHRFVRDPYLARNRVRSVLVHPLIHRGESVGVLYLENRLVAGAFDADRVSVLETLAGQIATSLENARLYSNLERLVEERTHELARTNERLTRTLRDLEQADQRRQDFVATISHELRTPMNAVMGMSRLLARTSLDERQLDYVGRLKRGGRTLLRLVDDLLDLSRIEAGRLQLESVPFHLDDVLDQVLEVTSSLQRSADVRLLLHRSPGVPEPFVGDPLRLAQVLINLVSNALKFTDSGHVVLLAAVDDWRDGEVVLRFVVEDTGIGMSTQQVDSLFQRYQQGDDSTSRRFGGTGLGLAISRHLLTMMGGRIVVDSQPGVGSTFSTVLRLPTGNNACVQPPPFHGLRLLLMDNHALSCGFLRTTLAGLGCTPTLLQGPHELATTRRAALRAGRDFEAILWVRHGTGDDEPWKDLPEDLPVIHLSERDGDSVTSVTPGASTRVAMPCTPSRLLQALRAVIPDSDGKLPKHIEPAITAGIAAGLRVLIVDDDGTNRLVLSEALQAEGARVEVAASGQAAIDAANRQTFDLVFMDIYMPEMDGHEATRRLRAVGLDDLPIIALSGAVTQAERDRCQASGMNDFVAKPLDPVVLRQAIRRWAL